jgi:16S rRNA (guanine527-N7)-methyltransferase
MKSLFPPSDPREVLIAGCGVLKVPVRVDMIDKMMRYMQLLREWNATVNLTTISDPVQMAILHVLDSLTALKVIPLVPGLHVMDVGSGGGFPGMILRVVEESWKLTVLDRDARKIVFLKHVAKELGLSGVIFLNTTLSRLLRRTDASLLQDVVVSRAFSSNPEVLDSFHGLVRSRGHLVRMAGPGTAEQDLRLAHFKVLSSWQGSLPFSDTFRRVVLYERYENAFSPAFNRGTSS